MRYRRRTLESTIEAIDRQFPVLLLTGPRQSGRTTLFRRVGAGRRYVTLDDPAVRELVREDPELFLDRYPPPLTVDEIQYAPGLLPHLKMRVDSAREPGAFWLTGPQQFQVMRGVTESLAGRVAILTLLGFSAREAARREADVDPFLPGIGLAAGARGDSSHDAVFRAIWTGSFPAPIAERPMDREVFLSSYLQTYLERDVRDLGRVGDLVLDIDGELRPVEIKRAATVRREWARAFTPLHRLGKPVGEGAVVCLTREPVPIGRKLTALPVGSI